MQAVSCTGFGIYTSLGLGSLCEHSSYRVHRLFIGAELNDLEGVSVLLKTLELFWVLPFLVAHS